jgi:tetratricopeptide (TPR) repeat protein
VISPKCDGHISDASTAFNVFISYSRSDVLRAQDIVAALEARGLNCTIDRRDLPYGERWQNELKDFIKAADAIIFLVSSRSIRSQWCNWELSQVANESKRLIPVVLEVLPAEELPPAIGEIHLFPLTDELEFEARADALAAVVLTDRAWVKEHTRLGQAADKWKTSQRRSDLLLRGAALSEAERWMAQRPPTAPAPGQSQLDYITASQVAAKRRGRNWTIGISAAALVATVLAVTAEISRREAEQARSISEQVLEGGRALTTNMVVDMVQRFRKTSGVPPDLINAVLTDMIKLIDTLQSKGGERPGLEQARALSQIELSSTERSRSNLQQAQTLANAAVDTLVRLDKKTPSLPGVRGDLVAAYDRLGDALSARGNPEEARKAYNKARDLANDLRNTMQADRQQPERWLANALGKIASTYSVPEKIKQATDANSEAIAILRSLSRQKPGDTGVLGDLGVALERQADFMKIEGQFDRAQQVYEESLTIADNLTAVFPANLAYARHKAIRNKKLGELLEAQGNAKGAFHRYQLAYDIARQTAQLNPNHFELQMELLSSASRLTEFNSAQNRDLVVNALRQAITATDIISRTLTTNLRLIRARAFTAAKLAELLGAEGQYGDAETYFDRAIKMLEKVPVAELSTPDGLNDLTGLYDKASRVLNESRSAVPTSARRAYEYSRRRYAALKTLGALSTPERNARALGDISWYALFARDYQGALTAANEALGAMRQTSDAPPLWIEANRAHATMLLGRADEALALYREHMNEDKWRQVIERDYEAMTKGNIKHPQMNSVAAMLASAKP